MNPALLVIDMQVGMLEGPSRVYDGKGLIERVNRLISFARRARFPVWYVQHCSRPGRPLEPGTPGWQLHPALQPAPNEPVIHKRHADAFHDTELDVELRLRGIRQLIITGIQTEICVDSTCRRAFSLGYDVILVSDGHSTWDRGELTAPQIIAHHNHVLRWFAEVKSTAELIGEFEGFGAQTQH